MSIPIYSNYMAGYGKKPKKDNGINIDITGANEKVEEPETKEDEKNQEDSNKTKSKYTGSKVFYEDKSAYNYYCDTTTSLRGSLGDVEDKITIANSEIKKIKDTVDRLNIDYLNRKSKKSVKKRITISFGK